MNVRFYAFCCWVIAFFGVIFAINILDAMGQLVILEGIPTMCLIITVPFVAGFHAAKNWAEVEPEAKKSTKT